MVSVRFLYLALFRSLFLFISLYLSLSRSLSMSLYTYRPPSEEKGGCAPKAVGIIRDGPAPPRVGPSQAGESGAGTQKGHPKIGHQGGRGQKQLIACGGKASISRTRETFCASPSPSHH